VRSRRKVFYAFLTTLSGFAILYFADFPLIRQLALFGIAALAFSYFQFSFLFASWRFEAKAKRIRLRAFAGGSVDSKAVLIVSLLLLGFSLTRLQFSGDLRQLDYQNDKLLALQEQIKTGGADERAILVYGDSLEALLMKMESIQAREPAFRSLAKLARSREGFAAYKESLDAIDFDTLRAQIEREASAVGFRPGTFANAYGFVRNLTYTPPDLVVAKALGFETLKLDDGRWLSLAFIDAKHSGELNYGDNLVLLEAFNLLQKGVEDVLEQLLLIAAVTLGFIALLLLVLLKKRALVAFNYVLFPLGVIASALAMTGSFSVMHLFALIIVMVAAIDYGIYMSDAQAETDEAIYYAMLTTFAGFGIFVFSHIGALHHIGLVIALGIASTFVLQTLQRRMP
jgi:predicted exporter